MTKVCWCKSTLGAVIDCPPWHSVSPPSKSENTFLKILESPDVYYPKIQNEIKYYKHPFTQNIIKNKFDDPVAAHALASMMFFRQKSVLTNDALTVVPVPNYDPSCNRAAVSIARELTKIIQKVNPDTRYVNSLKKLVDTSTHLLWPSERPIFWATNQIFQLSRPEEVCNQKILLIDDIRTTGNTYRHCVQELNKGNPSKIFVYTAAKTYHN